MEIWFSTSREIDGLWVGTTESKPHPALRRVEEALRLIKSHDMLNYSRVTHDLDRIWVNLIPSSQAHYDPSLNACVIDERYALEETTSIANIASSLVHEAIHARLDRWGVAYIEDRRTRIEAICRRRELNFLTKLPESGRLREEVMRSLEWLTANDDYYSDASFRERRYEGGIEALRYLGNSGAPAWFIRFAIWLIRKQQLRLRAMRNAGAVPPSRDFH
jgi:hypothetical protein